MTMAPGAPAPLAPSPPWRIAFVSFVVLGLELAFIRQIPAEVRAISYFTNLVLLAAFFGLGLGCITQERRPLPWLLPLGLALVLGFVLAARGVAFYEESRAVHFWLDHDSPPGQARRLPLLPAALFAFVAVALPFVSLGQALVRAMEPHPRLVAYGWDIAGSLLGTSLFALTAFFGVPPWAWVMGLLVAWALVMDPEPRLRTATAVAGTAFVALAFSPLPGRWSPYYFVQHRAEDAGLRVFVNSSFHQFAFDFSARDAPTRQVLDLMWAKWDHPYQLYRELNAGRGPRRVLVLGAGTGNDVVVALREKVAEVVAVEIDPVILDLGRRHNRSRPYADPRVRTVVDDARHYLKTAEERFDLVVFGTLDSQVLLSGHTNLRLENYVYTRESLADARRLLNDRGVLAVHYSVFKAWLYGRIYSTVRAVFGDQTLIRREDSPLLFNATVVGVKGAPELRDHPNNVLAFGGAFVATDDWPFLYVERPTVAPLYLSLLGFVALLVLGVLVLVRRLHPTGGLHAPFLFLGLGFTLMESTAVVRLALLFGSTWVVNAVIFSSVLLTIFLANLLVLRGRAPALPLCWLGLFSAILLNYFIPVSTLFALGAAGRTLAAGLLVGLPVCAAALCFSHLFARQPTTGGPLGINLVGAMGGGLLEYASMATGMRAVWLLALVVYVLAWLASRATGRTT